MTLNNGYDKYKENSINTASPEELTLMLYNGLVRFIMQGQKAINDKNIQKAHESIIRAQDIINEFMVTIDQSYEISKSLLVIYDYMKRRLVEANIHKDNAIIEEVLGMAKELRDTWMQAMKIAKASDKDVQYKIAK
jgi:flagellar secretion chaperone FliS